MQQFNVQERLEGVRAIGTDDVVSGPDVCDALTSFVSAHGQKLTKFAYLLTGGNGPQAEDLVQAVLARLVARGLERLDDPEAYVRRGIINEHHSAGRRRQVHFLAAPKIARPDATPEPSHGTEDRLTVLGALRVLSDRERAAVLLRYYEDLPDADIGAALGCSRPTVRSLIHRAMPKLKAELGATYPPTTTDPTETGAFDE